MGKMKKTQTTKVWGRKTLAPFQTWIFITAKPARLSVYSGCMLVNGAAKAIADNQREMSFRFLQVPMCAEAETEWGKWAIALLSSVLTLNRDLRCVFVRGCVCAFVWCLRSGTHTHTSTDSQFPPQPWNNTLLTRVSVWLMLFSHHTATCPFLKNSAWFCVVYL